MRFVFTLFFILGFVYSGVSQDKQLRAYLDHKQFYAPEIGNYVEFQLQFVGYSIKYKGKDNGLIGQLSVRMKITQGDSILQSDAYRLDTPFMEDSLVEDFYDIKRFALPPGKYDFHIELADLNTENEPLLATQEFEIEELGDAISISDITVAEYASKGDGTSPFYRSGYDLIPRLSTFYPNALNTIPVYLEIYNSNKIGDSVVGIKQTLVDANSGKELEEYTHLSRHKPSDVIPFLRSVNIETLQSGKYQLNFTLITKNMTELSTQTYEFERSNTNRSDFYTGDIVLDPTFQESIPNDSIGYYLESLIPISTPNEVKNIIKIAKLKNLEKARKHIQQYWTITSPGNAYNAWIQYKAQIRLVEKLYGNNFQEGYETDRGRVYLQYGSPTNIMARENSASEYPFEIWMYNKIGVFSNRRFIFYNPDLVNKTYRLLHSDMVGELKNPAWKREIASRNSTNGNIDDPNAGTPNDRFGTSSSDLFEQY
ncbi:MAG: GWxTD domain-containing protein [Crocinitomicaceae bacterium]|nr:GWxTD domain-containing protein [Crocinitomicaceae bacterium]